MLHTPTHTRTQRCNHVQTNKQRNGTVKIPVKFIGARVVAFKSVSASAPSRRSSIIDNELPIIVKTAEQIGNQLIGRGLKRAIDKEKQRISVAVTELLAQKVSHVVEFGRMLQFEFVLFQLRRVACCLEEHNHFALLPWLLRD